MYLLPPPPPYKPLLAVLTIAYISNCVMSQYDLFLCIAVITLHMHYHIICYHHKVYDNFMHESM